MTKSILAYFKTENDAESARASLERLHVTDVYVEKLPDEESNTTFIPLFTVGAATTGAGTIGESEQGGILANEMINNNEPRLTHILEGKVEETDYGEAIKILSDHNGYSKKD